MNVCRSRSSVGRALVSVWWQHMSRFRKSGVRGATGARCLSSILAGMVGLVAGRSQSKSAIETGCARLCAYVKLSTLNSAIDPELRDRKVEGRANATSSA